MLKVREANRLLMTGKPIIGTTVHGWRNIRITWARTRQAHLEGKEINTGKWMQLVDLREA